MKNAQSIYSWSRVLVGRLATAYEPWCVHAGADQYTAPACSVKVHFIMVGEWVAAIAP